MANQLKNRRTYNHSVYFYDSDFELAVEKNKKYKYGKPERPKGEFVRNLVDIKREDEIKKIKSIYAARKYNKRKQDSDDYDFFHRVITLLLFIDNMREYSYYEKFRIGRKFQKINRLDGNDWIERSKQEHPYISGKDLYGRVVLSSLRRTVRKAISSKINALEDDAIENSVIWDLHPALDIFLKLTKKFNYLFDIPSGKEWTEVFGDKSGADWDVLCEKKIPEFISHFNAAFESDEYKSAVKKRRFAVEKNIKSSQNYIFDLVRDNECHAIRFCLGFKYGVDNEMSALELFEPRELDAIKDKLLDRLAPEYKSSNKIFMRRVIFEKQMELLASARDKIFRNKAKFNFNKHIKGYIWKINSSIDMGCYMDVILFLDKGGKTANDVMESVGRIWRRMYANTELFVYLGKNNYILKRGFDIEALLIDIKHLFKLDILASVRAEMTDEKKYRTFGKGKMS